MAAIVRIPNAATEASEFWSASVIMFSAYTAGVIATLTASLNAAFSRSRSATAGENE